MREKAVKGFSIVEIMVALVIIGVLTAMVIPNLLKARIAGNEAAALAGLKAVYSAVQLYYEKNNAYPESLADLAQTDSSPAYIDAGITSGSKDGYEFSYSSAGVGDFSANAGPSVPGRTGNRYFYIDETGTIRVNLESEAGQDDPVLSSS